MYFMNGHLAWFLLIIPGLILFMAWLKLKDTLPEQYGVRKTLQKVLTTQPKLVKLKRVFLYMALFFIIVALLRPQWGMRTEQLTARGLDLVFCLDISKSMYAEDVQPDRLTRARLAIRELMERLPGNRVGLVVFAGSASVVSPLTTDYAALEVFLQSITSFSEAVPGTDLEAAVRSASTLYEPKAPQDKVCIIFTDGESHEGSLESLRAEAVRQKIIVIPVAVGTPAGQPVPEYTESGDRVGYKKDAKGNVVISRLDTKNLSRIASIGPYTVEQASLRIPRDLQGLKQAVLKEQRIALYAERYQGFLLIGFLLLVFTYCLSEYKDPFKK